MRSPPQFSTLLIALFAAGAARALEPPLPNSSMSYREVKTWHEEFRRGDPSKAARLEAIKEVIRTGPLGDRGLERVFRGFEGRYAIDPRIPGVEQSVLYLRSPSRAQAKGYRRELLYAVAFHNDSRFQLMEMNRPLGPPGGKTDADLLIRNRVSGLQGRVEVKDYSLPSQSSNLAKLKSQIDKMARERRHTGQPQFWLNRRDILPALQLHAANAGVLALGNVSTGRGVGGDTLSSRQALSLIDRRLAKAARVRTILGIVQIPFGLWMFADSASAIRSADINCLMIQATCTSGYGLRLGQSSAGMATGGGMVVSGTALLASRYAKDGMQASLYRAGRTSGAVSLAMFGIHEAFLIARYRTGDVTSREFWTHQWVQGMTMAGSGAGTWIGVTLGVLLFKEPLWLGALGGGGGAWAGDWFGQRTANEYYEQKFRKMDEEFGKFLYAHYRVN